MEKVTFFDTETTGLPVWKEPSGSENQPHLVQLGLIVADIQTEEEIYRLDVIIKPDGWIIPDEVAEIHGITTEQALDEGIDEPWAVSQLITLCEGNLRVCHNRTFDQRIIRIALKRYFDQTIQEEWASKDDFDCTMLMAKPIMELPPRGRWGYRNPTLVAALKHFTGEDLPDAHTAMADTEACMKIWFAMTREPVDVPESDTSTAGEG